MNYLKKIYRQIKRIINSFIVYVKIYAFTKRKNKEIKDLFKLRFDEVHVVCPGPTAVNLLKHDFNEKSAIIFVNHAVKLASKVKGDASLFYFSADATRTQEVLTQNYKEIKKCISILAPTHLFHMSKFSIFRSIDVILLPKTRLTLKFGLETIDNGPSNFSRLTKNPNTSGFGTFVYSLKLAVLFSPNSIRLWGTDFGITNGIKYFDQSTPFRSDTPFELIKKHFYIINEKINDMDINVF